MINKLSELTPEQWAEQHGRPYEPYRDQREHQVFKLTEWQKEFLKKCRKEGCTEEQIDDIKNHWQKKFANDKWFAKKWLSCPQLAEYVADSSMFLFKHLTMQYPMQTKDLSKIIREDLARHVDQCEKCKNSQEKIIISSSYNETK